MCACRGVQHVVLHGVERVERRHLLGLALQSPGHGREHVLLAVLEHLHLGAAVEQAALLLVVLPRVDDGLHDRLRRSALHHPLAGEVGREPHPFAGLMPLTSSA